MTVTISPPEAAQGGARWSFEGESQQFASGQSGEPQTTGRTAIVFADIPGFREPDPVAIRPIQGLPLAVDVAFTELPHYVIDPQPIADPRQSIPDETIWEGERLEFIAVPSDGSEFMLIIAEPYADSASYDPESGLFRYSPEATHKAPFQVQLASNTGAIASFQIQPMPLLPPEEEPVVFGSSSIPDPFDEDFITVTITNNPEEMFNDFMRETRSVTVSGKHIRIDADNSTNSLFDFDGNEDLRDFRIYAEKVVIADSLTLPQTNLAIYAQELVFEGADTAIDITPLDRSGIPQSTDGVPGHDAPTVEIYVESLSAPDATGPVIIAQGGRGQDGAPGQDGDPVPGGRRSVPVASTDLYDALASNTRSDFPIPSAARTGTIGIVITGSPDTINRALVDASGVRKNSFNLSDNEWPSPASFPRRPQTAGSGGSGAATTSTLDLTSLVDNAGGQPGDQATGGPYTGTEAGNPRRAYFLVLEGVSGTDKLNVWESRGFSTVETYQDLPPLPQADSGNFNSAPIYEWVQPLLLGAVMQHARQTYEEGNLIGARDSIADYEMILDQMLAADAIPSAVPRLELEQYQREIDALLQRIDSGLDYQGNPAGWVPMLSFEANYRAFENEIERAIPILYVAYWLQEAAETVEQRNQALKTARDNVREDLESLRDDFDQAQRSLPALTSRARQITAEIAQVQADLADLEVKLLARAEANVEEANRVPFWKKALRVLGTVAKVFPLGQPALGLVGEGLDLVTNVDPNDPLASAGGVQEIAGKVSEGILEESSENTREELEKLDFSRIEDASSAASYLGNFGGKVADLYGGIQDIRGILKDTEVTDSQVQAELQRIRASDKEFQELTQRLQSLSRRKAKFVAELNHTTQLVARLSERIIKAIMAIDAMNVQLTEAAPNPDPMAVAYLQEMEARQFERLRKYYYYLVKSYEYRILRPYGPELNLEDLFTEFRNLAEAGTGATLTRAQIEDLVAVFQDILADVASDITSDLQSSSLERNAIAQTFLTPAELEILNETGELRINLVERNVVPATRENVRIVNLGTDTSAFEASAINGTLGPDAQLSIRYEHEGRSRLRYQGKEYAFTHFIERATSPLFWETTYVPFNDDGTGDRGLRDSTLSAASQSLLGTLLDLQGEELLLYSRPGANAEILITKTFTAGANPGTASTMNIDRLRLRLSYDYSPAPTNYQRLQIVTQNPAVLPYFELSRDDEANRRDARGAFDRLYPTGSSVTVRAPSKFGRFNFGGWKDAAGRPLSSDPGDPTAITLSMNNAQTLLADFGQETVSSTIDMILGVDPADLEADTNNDNLIDVADELNQP
ncbi:MAG: hypothetical protein RLY93_07770 [Sumerlaeia bacterium]